VFSSITQLNRNWHLSLAKQSKRNLAYYNLEADKKKSSKLIETEQKYLYRFSVFFYTHIIFTRLVIK